MKTERSVAVISTLLCAMTLLGAAWARADSPPSGDKAPSLVMNGGFKDWQAAPDDLKKSVNCLRIPTGWTAQPDEDGTSCSLRCDTASMHGGRYSVRLANTDTKNRVCLGQRIAAEAEYRYVVRLWLKGDHIDTYHPKGVIVHVAASSQSDKHDTGLWSGVLRYSGRTAPPNNGTFDWHEAVFTFDTPVGTRSLLLMVELRGAGVLWLDNVRVIRLEKCKEVESY